MRKIKLFIEMAESKFVYDVIVSIVIIKIINVNLYFYLNHLQGIPDLSIRNIYHGFFYLPVMGNQIIVSLFLILSGTISLDSFLYPCPKSGEQKNALVNIRNLCYG